MQGEHCHTGVCGVSEFLSNESHSETLVCSRTVEVHEVVYRFDFVFARFNFSGKRFYIFDTVQCHKVFTVKMSAIKFFISFFFKIFIGFAASAYYCV